MYCLLAAVMLLRGFSDALLMRSQQAIAYMNPGYLPPDHYDQIFSARSFAWVDAILAAVAVAWVLVLVACVLVAAAEGLSGIAALLLVVLLVGAAVGLLMVVLRALLVQATALRTDLDGVI